MLNQRRPSSLSDFKKFMTNNATPPVLLCIMVDNDWHSLGGRHNVSDINALTLSFSIGPTLIEIRLTPCSCIPCSSLFSRWVAFNGLSRYTPTKRQYLISGSVTIILMTSKLVSSAHCKSCPVWVQIKVKRGAGVNQHNSK